MNNLIALYEAWNKPEKAEKWRTKLPQTENARKLTDFARILLIMR